MSRTRLEAMAHGDKFYSLGRVCKRNHPVYRRTSTSKCQECEPLDALLWHERNLDRAQARDRRYRKADPEKFKARDTARNRAKDVKPFKPGLSKTDPHAHKNRRAKQQRNRRVANPEKVREEARVYRDKNKDHMNARTRQDRVNNPEKYTAQGKRRSNTAAGRLRMIPGVENMKKHTSMKTPEQFTVLGQLCEKYGVRND